MPDMLPVEVQIISGSKKKKYQFQVIRNRELCPYFTLYSLYNTILVAEKLRGDACLRMLLPLYAVVQNRFEEARIKGVKFQIELQERIKSSRIKGVRVDKKAVKPGEEIQATVVLSRRRA
ncbi:MAG: hypothetical protein B1H40_05205 [Candidatus Latescibacteria bacterium 4484_181]|nr:MAG: hypothetical protein B1H40_05205 [Candidatus Latescibacteria bacterium 4484_181]